MTALDKSVNESDSADITKQRSSPSGSYGSHPPGVSVSTAYLPSYSGETAGNIVQNELRSERDSRTSGEAGVCGLRNLGNTCFMSAGVQCLVATPPLARALLDLQSDLVPPGHNGLTWDLADLMRQVWSGQYSSVHPYKFKDSLSKHYPQFNDYRQHDCQEFLALLLDGLHEQMNAVTKKDLASHSYFKGKFCDNVKAVNVNDKEFVGKQSNRAGWDETCYGPGTSAAASGDGSPTDCSPLVELSPVVPSRSPSPLECAQALSTSRPESPSYLNNSSAPPSPKMLNNVISMSQINLTLDTSNACDSEYSSTNNCMDYSSSPVLNNNPGPSSEKFCSSACWPFVCSSSTPDHLINNKSTAEPEQSNLQPLFGNAVCPNLASFEDILKNSKTSNVNVLGAETSPQAANNSFRFDSEKFPRVDNIRRKEGFSYNALGGGKRTPNSNIVGLDLKRVKLDDDEDKNTKPEPSSPKIQLEKNLRMENERKEKVVEAENHWQHHLANNRSVIVTTFQGQFKSQVVCSICSYISITYEPFMYLSVPLPNAMKKEFRVSFIDKLARCSEFSIEFNKSKPLSELRDKLLELLPEQPQGQIIFAEVLNHHVAKILDEHVFVRCINDINRSIYAFELINLEDYGELEEMDIEESDENNTVLFDSLSCNICLEERDVNLQRHRNCSFVICDNCVVSSCQHYGESWRCPTCSETISPNLDLNAIQPNTNLQLRLVNVCIVFRVELEDGSIALIGHPLVVKVANLCNSDYLISVLHKISPYKQPFTIRVVDGQGLWCGKCMYSDHCRGCEVSGPVKLTALTTLAVCLIEHPPEPANILPVAEDGQSCSPRCLSIYDCISAFSQSEELDANNPWFCPSCKMNQSATKTLSVWRYPDYLIVYLKRFVFHDHISTKIDERVEFPLEGLQLSGYLYDLYACVCHVGGVSAGHYTTYTLHSETGVWHYFNDSIVQVKAPREQEFSSAYILFYKKRSV